jgi:hypothetical protein
MTRANSCLNSLACGSMGAITRDRLRPSNNNRLFIIVNKQTIRNILVSL